MIERKDNGRWHVKPQGQTQYSATASVTREKAEAHLDKLNRGLVKFIPLTGAEHRPAFNPGFANGATTRNHLHQTL